MRSVKLLAMGLLCSGTLHAAISHPTFVLVHGALLTSSSWMAVQSDLQSAGYNVVTVDVPGRAEDGVDPRGVTLDDAAAKVCKVVSMQVNSVILVGHSQGGGVITQAVDNCAAKIKSLVYVAAVAPLNGEHVFDALSQTDNDNFGQCAALDKDGSLYKINYQGPIHAMFMADASNEQADRAIHAMVSEPAALGDGTLHYNTDVFNAKPKFYIETLQDKIIALETQRNIEKKIKPNKIYSMNSSHSPFISQHRQLAENLINIANQIK